MFLRSFPSANETPKVQEEVVFRSEEAPGEVSIPPSPPRESSPPAPSCKQSSAEVDFHGATESAPEDESFVLDKHRSFWSPLVGDEVLLPVPPDFLRHRDAACPHGLQTVVSLRFCVTGNSPDPSAPLPGMGLYRSSLI